MENINYYLSNFFKKTFLPWLLLTVAGIVVYVVVIWITIPIIEWIIKGFKKEDFEK